MFILRSSCVCVCVCVCVKLRSRCEELENKLQENKLQDLEPADLAKLGQSIIQVSNKSTCGIRSSSSLITVWITIGKVFLHAGLASQHKLCRRCTENMLLSQYSVRTPMNVSRGVLISGDKLHCSCTTRKVVKSFVFHPTHTPPVTQ